MVGAVWAMARPDSVRFELRDLPGWRKRHGGLEGERLDRLSVLCSRSRGRGRGCQATCVLRSPPQPWLHTAVTQGASERLRAQAAPSAVTSEFTEDTR